MAGTYGINSFYYSRILPRKKHIRNQLILWDRNACDEEVLSVASGDLAPLFLVDADNIDKKLYDEEDLLIVNPLIDAFMRNDQSVALNLSRADVKRLIQLAMDRRLTLQSNEQLAVKLAEEYNARCSNTLLRINMDIFLQICRDIDAGCEHS